MWPVDYPPNSVYSPLRVEQQLHKQHWRDAFEDLLALESDGERISLESRRIETEMAHKILYGKVSDMICMMNREFRDIEFLIQNINKQKVNDNGNWRRMQLRRTPCRQDRSNLTLCTRLRSRFWRLGSISMSVESHYPLNLEHEKKSCTSGALSYLRTRTKPARKNKGIIYLYRSLALAGLGPSAALLSILFYISLFS